MCVFVFVHVYAFTCVRACVCMHVCMYIYMNGGYMHSAGKTGTCTVHVYDYIVGVTRSRRGFQPEYFSGGKGSCNS